MKAIDDAWTNRSYTLDSNGADVKDGKAHKLRWHLAHLAKCVCHLQGGQGYAIQDRGTLTTCDKGELQRRLSEYPINVKIATAVGGTVPKRWTADRLISQPEWLPFQKEFETVVFHATKPGELSVFPGFPFQPKENPEKIKLWLQVEREAIAGGDPEIAKKLRQWRSYPVQNLNSFNRFAVVLFGGQGIGKGTWAKGIAMLWGPHFAHSNINDMN
jgi:hypothetical protein